MRPSERVSRKKKVKTPGGKFTFYRVKKKDSQSCGVTGEGLKGKRRSRAHPDVTSSISKELVKAKVRNYAKKE
ncbi:MAG: cell wall metabolism sensor histidine kinase WalK [Candidatus Altiarchaeota archaeon]|nr:cell wall metabolism sensor histidine kinase WalK [Candidatus Altiarchaeota archaeon]